MDSPPPDTAYELPKRNEEKRVRWYPPHPRAVNLLAAKAMEDTGDRIVAEALRRIAKADAQDRAVPNQYIVPERPDVIEWLESLKSEIDLAIHILQTQPDPVEDLTRSLPEELKAECEQCGKTFIPQRANRASYCSNACRQKAYRGRGGKPGVT